MSGRSGTQHKRQKLERKDSSPPKRGWDSWNELEKDTFFVSVQKYGRNFDAITKEVATKNYEQVRHFYYRVVKKINKILRNCGAKLDKQDPQEVLSSLLCYWQLRQSQKDEQSKHFAVSLNELMENRRSQGFPDTARMSPHVRAQPVEDEEKFGAGKWEGEKDSDDYSSSLSGAVPINSRFFSHTSLDSINVPENICIQLLPKYKEVAEMLLEAKHNPRLQLTLSSSKDVAYVIDYLNKKWVHYVDDQLVFVATGPIRLYPQPAEGLWTGHTGWGKEDNISTGSIFVMMGRPDIIKLEYNWLTKVKREREENDEEEVEVARKLHDNGSFASTIEFAGGPLSLDSAFITSYQTFPQYHSPIKLFSPTNPLNEVIEISNDGFGHQNFAEQECKNFYHHFEGSMNSQDVSEQQDTKLFSVQPSFRNVLSNVNKR